MKNLLISVLVFLGNACLSATIFTSTGSGNWTTSFSSSGSGTPVIYRILSGHTITVNSNVGSNIDTVYVSGILTFNNAKNVNMRNSGYVYVYLLGKVTGGNAHAGFDFSSGTDVKGPFNGSNEVNGIAYAKNNTSGVFVPIVPLSNNQLMLNATVVDDKVNVLWEFNHQLYTQSALYYSYDGVNFNLVEEVNYSLLGTTNLIKDTYQTAFVPKASKILTKIYLKVKHTDTNNEEFFTKSISIDVRLLNNFNVHLFPNPTAQFISCSGLPSEINEPLIFSIYNANGILIKHLAIGNNLEMYDLSSLNLVSGNYVLIASNTSIKIVKNFIYNSP